VVDAPGFSIDELAGNIATKQDRVSIARVKAAAGTAEPWLTLDYDEWLCVLVGTMLIEQEEKSVVEVKEGQTVMIEKGDRFRPSFPTDCEYLPVCLPAFRPDRCIREDTGTEDEAISANLKRLHILDAAAPPPPKSVEPVPEVLFHMTTKALWTACLESGDAYYPPTFEADGYFTHATGVPSRLIGTANHFYQDVEGEWVCLEFTRTALHKKGIWVRDEEALPVGDTAVGETWGNWVCPHVVGGIPPSIVTRVRSMTRDGKTFAGIEGI